ncbi:hypothetical protein [Pluralibacter sp.]|uniref:hypothetical protein n=1 Tax=Pluralibacter sp. TaxID=1920032 RepID=UPI0025D5D72D|nr:hypothetical protein [Pluralibacter sp.]MBV8044912.1 hypothetical protein [Pluralibacter sp.]
MSNAIKTDTPLEQTFDIMGNKKIKITVLSALVVSIASIITGCGTIRTLSPTEVSALPDDVLADCVASGGRYVRNRYVKLADCTFEIEKRAKAKKEYVKTNTKKVGDFTTTIMEYSSSSDSPPDWRHAAYQKSKEGGATLDLRCAYGVKSTIWLNSVPVSKVITYNVDGTVYKKKYKYISTEKGLESLSTPFIDGRAMNNMAEGKTLKVSVNTASGVQTYTFGLKGLNQAFGYVAEGCPGM